MGPGSRFALLFLALMVCGVWTGNGLTMLFKARYCVGLKVAYARLNVRLLNVWKSVEYSLEKAVSAKQRCGKILKFLGNEDKLDVVNIGKAKRVEESYHHISAIEHRIAILEKSVHNSFNKVLDFCDNSRVIGKFSLKLMFALKIGYREANGSVLDAEALSITAQKRSAEAHEENCSSEHFWEVLDDPDDDQHLVNGSEVTVGQ
ncbi:Putative cell surface-expressed gene family [Trypanosoma congolense IL3000]|uniref:Putative cell surface-expressed gene family n=1 Tax=Trypanosoma congolense (strain IL3000) TaxID=1068625 RepID=F9W908_TRYCI|nr:Putative cell surface-expressed gene family [Trypanosoma congolense IL3000]